MGVKERYEAKKNNLKSNSTSVKADSTTTGVKERYEAKKAKNKLLSTINFDTFETDLSSMGKTIGDIYNGWQTQETMKNTLSSVQNMYDRLGKYQEYQKQYGGVDLSELQSNYKSILDGWEDVAKTYSRYKSADAYNNENKRLKELGAMKSSDVKAEMDRINSDVADLEGKLKTAKEYEQNVKKFTDSAINMRNPSAAKTFSESVKRAISERDSYLKSIGYGSVKDLKKALSNKSIAYTTVGGENITWQSLYDTKKYKEDSDALYKEISSRDDFKKYRGQGANIENPTYEEAEGGINLFGWRPFSEDVENKVEYAIDNKAKILADEMFSPGGKPVVDIVYSEMTSQERDIYNYHLGREREGLAEEGTADEYLNSIYGTLKDRYENKIVSGLSDYADEHPVWASVVSVGQNLFSGAEYVKDSVNYFKTGELDDNQLAKASSSIRGTVSGKVDWEIGNWDAFDFLYNTGMSGIDSAVAMATFGNVGGTVLGLSAAAQGTNDALTRGLDNKSAFWSGLSAGVFECLFETYSIGKFKALKDAPVDGVKSIIKNVGKSMLTNASEETLTELANLTYDYFANGDLSQAKTNIRAYMSAGMSEKEAIKKVALEQAAQVVEAGASGGLMGIGFGGVSQASAYSNSKAKGQNIKTNERVADMFDIASTSPEISSAYEAYTHYANKGINADNITDAQLGRLYSSAKADAVETISSKKTTDEQKQSAMKTLARLSVVDTENTLAKEAREKLNIGEETKETKSGVAVDVKDLKIRVNGDDVTVATDNGKISVDDMTLAQNDAELVILAEGIAKTEGEDIANLFLSQYDGKTNAEEYATSFNLTMAYAKNDFTYDTILNKKGSLSAEQVSNIYAETRIKADRDRQEAIDKLIQDTADKKFYKGYIDDSAIDEETWNKLDSRQKQAVTFIKGFAQMAGMNLVLTHNPKSSKGGSYNITNNTITVDIAKYEHIEKGLMETIIPTMSHETTHWMEEKSPELWRKLNEVVFSTLQEADGISETARISIEMSRLKNKGRKATEKEARSEIVARACEDILSMSEQGKKMFNSLSESEQKTLKEKIMALIQDIKDWVSEFLGMCKSDSYEAKLMRKYEEKLNEVVKIWDEMLVKSVEANQALEKSGAYRNKTSAEGKVLEQARELQRKDPTKLTEGDFKNLLSFAKQKLFVDDSYIPARIGTPQILIDFAREQGYVLENHPLAMRVYKARQALSNESEWDGKPSDKPHDLSIEEVTEIVKAMNNPSHLIYQTKNDRFAEIVKFEKYGGKQKAYAIIDFFDVDKNPEYMNGYEGGKYNILVTIYPSENNSELKEYLNNKNNIVMTGDEIKKKAISQRGSGSFVPSHLNDMAFYTDSILNPDENVKEKFADRDDMRANLTELNKEYTQLERELSAIKKSDEYLKFVEDLSTLPPGEEYDRVMKEYGKWVHKVGFYSKSKRMNEIKEEQKNLKSIIDNEDAMSREAFMKAVDNLTKGEKMEIVNKAVATYGTTDNVSFASYLMLNGEMLDFSEGQGYRVKDHREISEILDMPESAEYSDSLIAFMNMGNIRMQTYGIDISQAPNQEQKTALRDIISQVMRENDEFSVDFSKSNGYTDGSVTYPKGTSASKILADIDSYFESGVVPEYESSISEFLYADRNDDAYLDAVKKGDVETASRLVEEAVEKAFANSKVRGSDGKLRLVYHGTVNDFTVFKRQFANIEGDFGKGYYFTSNEYDVDANYANEEGPDLKNKIARLAERLEWSDEYADLSYEEREELARQTFITSEPNTITAYLNMENPVYITPDENGTLLDFNESYDEEYDEFGEPEGLLVDFIEALNNNASDYAYNEVDFSFLYEYAYDNGGVYVSDAVKIIKNRILDELTDENGDLAINEVIRLAFEEIGFDGIIDTSVYYKFRNMDGMDSGTTHYIVFNSEQIKSADIATYDDNGNVIPLSERFNKQNDDIRYADRDDTSVYDLMGEKARLLKENEKFKAEIERLNERLKLERKVTKGNFFNENQLGAVAGHLRNISKSNIDKVELMKELKDVYSFIAHSPGLTWEEVFEKCYRIANNMLAEAKPEVVVDDYSKRILREIRETRISLDESQKKEASYIFGKNWNRYFFGKVILADDGISIDSKWQEWADQYPDIFEAGISDGDMIGELYDIINNLRDASETIAEYDTEEQTRWLAREIYNQYWNVSPIRTTADKYDKQIKRLNFEHRNAMKEFREEYNSRLKKQHKADKEKYAELVAKIRERKDKEIASAKEHGKEMLSKYRENAERKTRIQSITANALTLNKWLTKNSKDYHIHEAMKGPVIKLLQAIDFSSNSQLEKGVPTQIDASFAEAFSEVKTMLVNAENMVEGLEALYGHDLAETIDLLSKAAFRLVGDNNYIINKLSIEELKSLDKLVRHIKKVVTDLNKFHTVHHNQGAVNLANEFMEYGDKLGKLKKQDGDIGKFLKFRNRTPYYFFKALGKPGKKLFEAFQDGWDKLAFNAKKVIDFAKETYTAKEVKEWSKETKEFTITQLDGSSRTFNMTIAQIMALHCVFKQEDAQRHLLSSGMTLKRFDSKGNVVADYENIRLTISDINSILGTLNDRQREVADALQKFMNTVCATWGNEISMARFGIEMFGIPDYFPIKVSESTVPTDNSKEIDAASLFRLLNMSFTKSRNKYAEQSIEIGDIFNIFARHTSDMAKYNALALPVLDFNKWYSIHGKDMSNKEYGVVNTLKTVFGDEANVYLRRFVRDLNGSQNVSRDAIGKKFFKNSKVAAVANNLRVILLQPTAYLKASAEMDNKYLLKAKGYVKVNPISLFGKLKKAVENAEKYCGIVQWKSLGYYDTDISKGIAEKIKHADTFKDKAIEKSLKGAELADKATFGTLWIACEFEIRDKHPELNPGTEEFYKKVGLRLREVIYATQVVDSTMTRSDMMRSPDGLDKMFTTFGSEPTIAYNMLLDLAMQYNLDKRELGSRKEALKKNSKKIRKVVTAYVITNALAALVESGFDAFRDDDDEEMDAEKFLKLYFKNFALDLSIGNKLPYVKELYSILQGYSSSRLDTQWMEYLNRLVVIGYKVAEGKGEGQGAKAVNYILKLASSFVGYGFYNAYRDMMATLNKLDLFTTEDLNEMFDDFFN